MSNFFNNPENALRRANEFLELGKEDEAIDCLYDILKSKKNRILKNVHEAVINKLLEICVDRKMSTIAKDGLYSYRVLCLGINIKSWEDAVKRLISLAEHKIEIITEEVFKCEVGTVCSLDKTVTPEYLLELISESNNDKDEKWIALFPWIKFNWECYRICLDLLRNTQVERFYHYVAQKALHFCRKYQRKTEFHKLCHVLRVHFGYLYKQKSQFLSNVNNPETIMLYLETETAELEIALELELWQEVYKAIENLHFLIEIAKRLGNSKIIANYYKQLCHVFLKTGDFMYHAAAFFRYFSITKELKKSLDPADVTALSSSVVLAVLAIPFPPNDPTIDLLAENDLGLTEKKHRSLSELLNFSGKLSRKTLVEDIDRCGVVENAQMDVQRLFHLFENELDPLNIGKRTLCFTKAFSESSFSNRKSLNLYLKSIFDVSITIILSQLSKIYETITWKKFMSLVPLSDEFYVEWLVVEIARKYGIPVRLDHCNSCLRFDTSHLFQNSSNEGGIEVRQLPVDKSLNYLSHVYTSLRTLGRYLDPEYFKGEEIAVRKIVTEQYLQEFGEDRVDILQRKIIIERHKEMVEKMRLKKEEEERNHIAAKQLEFEIAEKQRLLKEAENRAQQKRMLQQEEMRKKILHDKIEILKKSELGEILVKLDTNELDDLDPEVIISKHFEQVIREKKGFILRLHKQERTTNHMERAKRIEEVPLLKQKYEEETFASKSLWEKDEKRRIETALEERENNVREKERLLVMKHHLNDFLGKIMERRKLEYLEKCNDFQKVLEQEREKRLKERAIKRKLQRRLQWIEEQEEAKRFRTKNVHIAEEGKDFKVNKILKGTSSHSEVKCSLSNDNLIEDKHNKCSKSETRKLSNNFSKFPKQFPNEMSNVPEKQKQSLKEGDFEQHGSNKHEKLAKNSQSYITPKYQDINQLRKSLPNKRYEDRNERKFITQSSPKQFTKSIGSFSRSQTSNEANCDYSSPDRRYKESNIKSIATYREKNSKSPDTKDQVQKDTRNYSSSPNVFTERSETSSEKHSSGKNHISQRKYQQKYTLLRQEESLNKYISPLNMYSESKYDYDKSKHNALDNFKYSERLEPCYHSDKETFSAFKTVPNSDETIPLGAGYKQERSISKNFDDKDYYARNVFNPQESCKRNESDFVRRNETKSDRSCHQDKIKSALTNESLKYEVRYSCTPWAKLHRGKE